MKTFRPPIGPDQLAERAVHALPPLEQRYAEVKAAIISGRIYVPAENTQMQYFQRRRRELLGK